MSLHTHLEKPQIAPTLLADPCKAASGFCENCNSITFMPTQSVETAANEFTSLCDICVFDYVVENTEPLSYDNINY